MAFGSKLSDYVNGVVTGVKQQLFGNDYLRDYKHASNLFRSDALALAPQTKFLYHVFFSINPNVKGLSDVLNVSDIANVGMMVKNIQLPSFKIDVKEVNQYNRKRLIQEKINYDPVTVVFHDDGSDLIRSMWYNYYSYYYSDPKHQYAGIPSADRRPFDYARRDIYDNDRSVNDWGYTGESPFSNNKEPFFNDIKIYGLNRGNFVQYTLINPLIVNWNNDRFDYAAANGTMEHNVTIKYETVKYYRGRIGEAPVDGFGKSDVYDTTPSPLSAGSTVSVYGQGGLFDSVNSALTDLSNGNVLQALITARRTQQTWDGQNIGEILQDETLREIGAQITRPPSTQSQQFVFPQSTQTAFNTNRLNVSTVQSVPVTTVPASVSSNGQPIEVVPSGVVVTPLAPPDVTIGG